ncbi:YqeG family HAD IIIA-type phosphatase [Geitlerinema sp. PCC 9228]|uniref:YqeG family HAD IIIA-type phosphatase n=1 Tax=Geitlerinema sp. PCC 9228 TaxID=111611 RepID=UPI0008F9E186|nr:YqeG family HAD IIIA-type phosphatase [Geitlerinema sp. PCC 9228]
MSWGKLLEPDLILGDCVVALHPDILRKQGLKGLVLDVDETLVPLNAMDTSEDLHDWVEQVRPFMSLWLVSNNLSERRIGRIARSLNLPYITGAQKPSRRKLRQAVRAMDLPISQVAMVGDRLFTDVLAGNRLGMFTILVEPMVSTHQGERFWRTRSLEIWISQILGACTPSTTKNFTKRDKS